MEDTLRLETITNEKIMGEGNDEEYKA